MTGQEKNILITDDHSITRLGLGLLCKEIKLDAEVIESSSIEDTYRILKTNQIRLLILDLFLDDFNCLSAIPEILKLHPKLNILVITMAEEEVYGSRIINAGALGYVNKLDDNEALKTAIFRVYHGNKYISHRMYLNYINSDINLEKSYLEILSDKELEIANYLVMGYSIGEIADKARLAISTVSTYKNRIFTKLKIDNIVALVEIMKRN